MGVCRNCRLRKQEITTEVILCEYSRRLYSSARVHYIASAVRGCPPAPWRPRAARPLEREKCSRQCSGRSRQKLEEEPLVQLHGNWSSFQLAISTSPLGVIDNAIAPPARMPYYALATSLNVICGARMSLGTSRWVPRAGVGAIGAPEKLAKSH